MERSDSEYKEAHFEDEKRIIENLIKILKSYTIMNIVNFIYIIIVYIQSNDNHYDANTNVDQSTRLYVSQYDKFSGNENIDTLLHMIYLLMVGVFIQLPFVIVMWPKKNIFRQIYEERQKSKRMFAKTTE